MEKLLSYLVVILIAFCAGFYLAPIQYKVQEKLVTKEISIIKEEKDCRAKNGQFYIGGQNPTPDQDGNITFTRIMSCDIPSRNIYRYEI